MKKCRYNSELLKGDSRGYLHSKETYCHTHLKFLTEAILKGTKKHYQNISLDNAAVYLLLSVLCTVYFLTCTPNEDFNQPAHSHSLIGVFSLHEETLHPWLSKMHPVKILIRRRECAG